MISNENMMRGRWPTPDAFYHERDNRTALVVGNVKDFALQEVEIRVDPAKASDPTVQRIALVAANITSRWARRSRVVVPDVCLTEALPAAAGDHLPSRILREMRAADPFGDFKVTSPRCYPQSDRATVLRLLIGPWEGATIGKDDYVVDASGWTARGRRGGQDGHRERKPATVPAAALAGAIGAADLFKRAIRHDRSDWLGRFEWSTWSHCFAQDLIPEYEPSVPTEASLGRFLLAGVGAIGSALLYVISLMPVSGEATLLDKDQVDTTNLNRSPLFTALDAAMSRDKTAVAAELLHELGLAAHGIVGTWREHGERLSREHFDVWVSLTNEDAAWAAVPFQLPPVVVHGTTTSEWGVNFGRHIPRIEDCTLCRLPRPEALFRGPCTRGDLSDDSQVPGPRASLPFLSTVAASLVAAELIKLPIPDVADQPNDVQADFRSGLKSVLRISRATTQNCRGCMTAKMPVWVDRGGRSRYAKLSEP